jgi:hypothetical protein
MDDYTWWFDEWGSWDLCSPFVSEIDEDIEKLLLVYILLFGEYHHQRKIKFQHICVDWDYHARAYINLRFAG